jgi:hypothetical protein
MLKIDKRFRPAMLVTNQINELATALGGEDAISPQQKLVVQRAAWAHQRLQEMEGHYAQGHGLDAQEWATFTGVLFSALKLLGMKRVARRVPSLQERLAE